MATKSFVSSGLPPQMADLNQLSQEQEMLVEQLRAQEKGLTPGTMDAGALRVLDFSGLGNAIAAQRTKAELSNSRKKSADAIGAYQKGLAEKLGKFRLDEQGTPREELPGPGAPTAQGVEGPGPSVPAVQGDDRAFLRYLDSPYPEVKAAAQAAQIDYQKRFEEAGKRASLASLQTSGGNMGKLAPTPKDIVVDGAIARTVEGQAPTLAPGTGFKQVTLPDGTVANQSLLTGKQDSVSRASSMKTDVNLPGNRVMDTMIKGLPDDLKAANAANSAIRGTETALDALGKGARAGFGEEYLQNARTLVSGLTGVQFEASTPTGVLAKALAKNVIDELGGLGAQISNTDREFMATAVGGLNTDPAALERILAIRLAALQKSVDKHNADVEALASDPKNDAGDFTRRKYTIPRNRITVKFNSPEAEASYVAGQTNSGYEDALAKVRKMRQGEKGGQIDLKSPDVKARLKALGFPE
jgi:hypothetical protein